MNKLLLRVDQNLKIRTYSVVCLNEECGIIQWVPNTCTYRSIVTRLYKQKKVSTTVTELKCILDPSHFPKGSTVGNVFKEKVVPLLVLISC